MKQPRLLFAFLLATWALPAPAAQVFYQGNIELWWDSSMYTSGAGVPIYIRDLAVPPGLSGVRLELRFDAAQAWFSGVGEVSGTALGDYWRDQIQRTVVRYPAELGDVEWTGRADITWTSLLSPAELLARQTDGFFLLSLGVGLFRPGDLPDLSSMLVRRRVQVTGELFDAFGAPIPDVEFINDVVPEPATGWALVAGVTLLALRRAAK